MCKDMSQSLRHPLSQYCRFGTDFRRKERFLISVLPIRERISYTMSSTNNINGDATTSLIVKNSQKLIALGFCGVDDSIHPRQLAILSYTYPLVEFGVLFRPDKEGTPRYASRAWVEQLRNTAQHMKESTGHTMKLAAHLCSTRVNDLLRGNNLDFLQYITSVGFQRVQINATAVNGVDTSHLTESVPTLWSIIQQYQELEFIFQKNDETKPLWEPIEVLLSNNRKISNISMLLDESKGTGIVPSTASWPKPSILYRTGYAGGIGPNNVGDILQSIIYLVDVVDIDADEVITNSQKQFWIDMESSLRSIKNGNDVFDLDKCFQIIDTVCTLQLMKRPNYLNSC